MSAAVEPDAIRVRQARPNDISAIVCTHVGAFPDFFLTLLGPAFLARLYRGFAEEDVAMLLVAETDGDVSGFVAGSRAPLEFFRRMRRKHGVQMACVAIPSLLRHPVRVAERLFAAANYAGDQPPDLPGYWLLSSLGVAAEKAGRGMGEALVRRFCEKAAAASGRGVYLLTDADDNDRTLGFYRKCGFSQHSVLVRRDGRRLAVIVRNLADE